MVWISVKERDKKEFKDMMTSVWSLLTVLPLHCVNGTTGKSKVNEQSYWHSLLHADFSAGHTKLWRQKSGDATAVKRFCQFCEFLWSVSMAKHYHACQQSFLYWKMWKKWTNCWLLMNMIDDDIQFCRQKIETHFPGSGST